MAEIGKEYPWPRPEECPKCLSPRMWRHGFVLRYFDDYAGQLWMLKYRCDDCGSVHTMRPLEYERMFRAQWFAIFFVLLKKIATGRWSTRFSKERQRYWMKGFRFRASRQSNATGKTEQLRALQEMTRHTVLGTHSARFFEIKPYRDIPHPIFSLTPESRSP